MNLARKLDFLSMLALMIPAANAAVVAANVGRITNVITYTTYGTNDVTVYTQYHPPGCDGFWFRSSEQNGKEIFAQILSAQQTQPTVWIWAYDDQIWTGTSSRFCRIYAVSLETQ